VWPLVEPTGAENIHSILVVRRSIRRVRIRSLWDTVEQNGVVGGRSDARDLVGDNAEYINGGTWFQNKSARLRQAIGRNIPVNDRVTDTGGELGNCELSCQVPWNALRRSARIVQSAQLEFCHGFGIRVARMKTQSRMTHLAETVHGIINGKSTSPRVPQSVVNSEGPRNGVGESDVGEENRI
jgi:hypothetical protein